MIGIVVSAVAGYLLGSIPTGYLAARLWGVDVLKTGSGRTGGANVLRSAGPIPFLFTMVGDLGKGYLAVILPRLVFPAQNDWAAVAAALLAIAGHNWSIFLRGRGGAGGGTTIGALLAMVPIVVIPSVVAAIIVMLVSKYVSLGTMIGSLVILLSMVAVTLFFQEPIEHLVWATGAVALVIFAHRPNIDRLLKGTERKMGGASP